MGDPETEVVLPRLSSDLVDLFVAVGSETLSECSLAVNPKTAVTTIIVSGGYPGDYVTGKKIEFRSVAPNDEVYIFHAGTQNTKDGIVSSGGRVLAVTAFGEGVQQAADLSRRTIESISFEGMYFRSDIGYEFK
jgi:phosphoribosylamine--glycine ligase